MPTVIGEMRERVSLYHPVATRDDYNAEIISWNLSSTVWARVIERGGREPILADRPAMLVSYEVTVRAGVSITNKDRLLWGDKTLSVETVTPLSAQGLIIVRCFEAEQFAVNTSSKLDFSVAAHSMHMGWL